MHILCIFLILYMFCWVVVCIIISCKINSLFRNYQYIINDLLRSYWGLAVNHQWYILGLTINQQWYILGVTINHQWYILRLTINHQWPLRTCNDPLMTYSKSSVICWGLTIRHWSMIRRDILVNGSIYRELQ